MRARISKRAARQLAEEAFRRDVEKQLTPAHLELWRARQGGQYEMSPQADEWAPVVGFVPDPDMFYEYGFMVVDQQQGRTVLVCRVLVDRNEDNPSVRLDWYPTQYDSRKRPN